MNQLYQQMMGNRSPSLPNNNISQIKQMMNMFRGSNNPQQLLMNLANQNPQMKQVMTMVQNSGKSPKDLFYELARQKGVNPDEILKQLQ